MKHDPRGIRACFMAAVRARSVGNILVRQSKCQGFSPSTQELRTLACDDDISCQPRCDAVLNRTPFCVATTYCLQKFEVGIKNRSFHQSASRRAEKEGGSSFLEDLPKKSFLNSLLVNVRTDHRLEGREQFLRDEIELKFGDLMQRHSAVLVDGRANAHLQMAAVVLASYRTLLPFMSHDKEAVIAAIRAPAGAAASTTVDLLQRLALLLSWNKFEYAKTLLKNMDSDYGKAFKIEHVTDDKSHEARVSHCLYKTFFEAEGAPELTSIFCSLDRMWFSQLSSGKHKVEFSRPTTLAEGAEACRFIVQKV